MSKVCAFTIVAKNYIGLAQILGESIVKVSPEIDFKIIVADTFEAKPKNLPENVLIAKEFLNWNEAHWIQMTFQYDLTQFCTAIKPSSILYLLNKGYEKVLYFDPDIFIFSSLSPIVEALDEYQVVLTPQIAGIHINYSGEHPEWAMNCNGIFNLGFGGYRFTPKVIQMLQWWEKRLETECFSDRTVGNFTDQKWMDWVPGFFNGKEFSSLDSLGMNLAPWNFFERKIVEKNGEYYVVNRTDDNPPRMDKLVFIHFAGYDYQALKNGEIKRKRINELKDYDDLLAPIRIYRDEIVNKSSVFDSFINQQYSYGTYDNGESIEPFHRRLYHGLLMNNFEIKNPFQTGENTFYSELKKIKMMDKTGMSRISRAAAGDVSSKRKIIEKLFSFIYKVGGYKRYALFVKSLIDYCRPEYHTFLINVKKIGR